MLNFSNVQFMVLLGSNLCTSTLPFKSVGEIIVKFTMFTMIMLSENHDFFKSVFVIQKIILSSYLSPQKNFSFLGPWKMFSLQPPLQFGVFFGQRNFQQKHLVVRVRSPVVSSSRRISSLKGEERSFNGSKESWQWLVICFLVAS